MFIIVVLKIILSDYYILYSTQYMLILNKENPQSLFNTKQMDFVPAFDQL